MNIESLEGPVSLAHALIGWTNPTLVEAIRAETSKVDPELIDRADRFTLDSITRELREPKRRRVGLLTPRGLDGVDRAWVRLFHHARSLVACGELILAGLDTFPVVGRGVMQIPADRAAELDFAPAAGAVHLGIDTFFNVKAFRPRPAAATNLDSQLANNTEADVVPTAVSDDLTEARNGPGRASFEPLIREALNDRWDDIRRGVEKGHSWPAIAAWLWKHLDKKYPGWAHLKKLPSAYTIRTRLSRWYPGELANRTVQ